MRGVGPRLDEQGRYYLYRKLLTKKFPNDRDIGDKLVALSMLYGSSTNLEAAQIQYIKAYAGDLPKPSPNCHDFPLNMSEMAEKVKEDVENSKRKQVYLSYITLAYG